MLGEVGVVEGHSGGDRYRRGNEAGAREGVVILMFLSFGCISDFVLRVSSLPSSVYIPLARGFACTLLKSV